MNNQSNGKYALRLPTLPFSFRRTELLYYTQNEKLCLAGVDLTQLQTE